MAKLVRINTTDANANFNETLTEDLIIDENSSVALQSVSFTRQNDTFVLTQNNNKFRFGTKGYILTQNYEIKNFFTRTDIINISNISNFLLDLQSSINMTLCPFGITHPANRAGGLFVASPVKAQHDSGTQIQVVRDVTTSKVQIQIEKNQALKWTSADANVETHFSMFNATINRDDANDVYIHKTATDDNGLPDGVADRSFICDKRPACMGGSYFSANVKTFNNMTDPQEYTTYPTETAPSGVVNGAYDTEQAGQSGFYMGLVDSDGLAYIDANVFVPERHFYAYVGLRNNALNPYFYGFGRDTQSGDGDVSNLDRFSSNMSSTKFYEAGDQVGIGISLGRIKFFLGRANGDRENFLNSLTRPQRLIDYQRRTYYWVVCLLGATGKIQLTNVEATNDPYSELPTGITQTHLGTFLAGANLGVVPVPANDDLKTNAEFRFEYNLPDGTSVVNTELRDFLGFSETSSNQLQEDKPTHLFTATLPIDYLLKVEGYIVLLNNVPIDAYDTEQFGGKKNILYTIVKERDVADESVILFNTQYPIFLDMKNKNPLSLRSIQARIVNNRYEPILVNGLTSMTLLIKKNT